MIGGAKFHVGGATATSKEYEVSPLVKSKLVRPTESSDDYFFKRTGGLLYRPEGLLFWT